MSRLIRSGTTSKNAELCRTWHGIQRHSVTNRCPAFLLHQQCVLHPDQLEHTPSLLALMGYKDEVQHLAVWCANNNLALGT